MLNKSLLYNLIVIRVIHFILAILAAVIVAGAIAFIAALITEDIESIVISCLVGVWIVEVILYIARCKIIFNKRMKTIDEVDPSEIDKKKNNFIKRYIIFSIMFAIVFGFVLYNLKVSLVNDLTGGNNLNQPEGINYNWLTIKIGIVVILLAILMIKLAIRKRYKSKMANAPENKIY
jgi:ABC-type uncharacterized transport system permease subunit